MSNPIENVKPSARVRMALRLYETGACKTKEEASKLSGLSPHYLTMLTAPGAGSTPVKRLQNELSDMIDNEAISTTVILQKLGRKALGRLVELMNSESDHIAFRAAQDLADRAPDTSKTQKVQLESFSLSGQDAKELAAALVESAKQSSQFHEVTTKGLIEVKDLENLLSEAPSESTVLPEPEARPSTTLPEG